MAELLGDLEPLGGSPPSIDNPCLEVPDDYLCFQQLCQDGLPCFAGLSDLSQIRRLSVFDHVETCSSARLLSGQTADSETFKSAAARPMSAEQIHMLLKLLPGLEELEWRSSSVPPDGLCELLSTFCPRLSKLSMQMRSCQAQTVRSALAKWDAPSLPLLSNIPITTLNLSRLSQRGSRAFARLLENMADEPVLEDLSIDFVWLDESLCEKIAAAGRKLKKLQIGTSGTKLGDRGVILLMEGCDSLQEFTMDEVQGRLSRNLWQKPSSFPPSLRTLRIVMGESGTQHSWTADHLDSIHSFPLDQLMSLAIVRKEFVGKMDQRGILHVHSNDDIDSLKAAPAEFVEALRDAKSLTTFECDFWTLDSSDVKTIISNCVDLTNLRFCLDEPFCKLYNVSFTSVPNLQALRVSVNSIHAPGQPPRPLLPDCKTSLPTPADSPVLKSKTILPQLHEVNHSINKGACPTENGDPSFPLLREVKRFVRKCPNLSLLDWYGKDGRGSWQICRPASASKTSINVTVDYHPPRIQDDVWQIVLTERYMDAIAKAGVSLKDIARDGQDWKGELAERYAAENAEMENAEPPSPTLSKTRRTRVPSLLTSPNATENPILSPTNAVPLTPPASETSVCDTSSSTDVLLGVEKTTFSRRDRSPSEPNPSRPSRSSERRTRAATSSHGSRGRGHNSAGAAKSGRSRGGASSRGNGHHKAASTSEAPIQGANARISRNGTERPPRERTGSHRGGRGRKATATAERI